MTPFERRVWLSSPTMHGDEMHYMTEAYETNWMSTVGLNIQEVERIAAQQYSWTMPWHCPTVLLRCIFV